MMYVDIERLAEDLLDLEPSVVVRWRLMRDVAWKYTGVVEMELARQALDQSCCVQELAREQWPDGSWGAFHSRNSKRKQPILTTELGVERGVALGLDAIHPILQRAGAYLLRLLCGEISFPDYNEKNDRWLASLELLAQCFPSWISIALPGIDWLWAQQDAGGYWDFGSLPAASPRLPLSDSWRDRRTRRLDWTLRVLVLLKRASEKEA